MFLLIYGINAHKIITQYLYSDNTIDDIAITVSVTLTTAISFLN